MPIRPAPPQTETTTIAAAVCTASRVRLPRLRKSSIRLIAGDEQCTDGGDDPVRSHGDPAEPGVGDERRRTHRDDDEPGAARRRHLVELRAFGTSSNRRDCAHRRKTATPAAAAANARSVCPSMNAADITPPPASSSSIDRPGGAGLRRARRAAPFRMSAGTSPICRRRPPAISPALRRRPRARTTSLRQPQDGRRRRYVDRGRAGPVPRASPSTTSRISTGSAETLNVPAPAARRIRPPERRSRHRHDGSGSCDSCRDRSKRNRSRQSPHQPCHVAAIALAVNSRKAQHGQGRHHTVAAIPRARCSPASLLDA